MNDSSRPTDGSSKNLQAQARAASKTTDSKSCESRKSCRYCKVVAWLLSCAIVLIMIVIMGCTASKDTAQKDTPPKDTAPKTEALKDKAPKDTTPKDAAPKDAVPEYTAKAYLRVSYQEKALVFSSGQRTDPVEYKIFKNTQKQLIKNPFVLNAALRKPEIRNLPILKGQKDPVAWLMKKISVSSPENSEIMEISLSADDPQVAVDIVTAVMDAYMSEVVDFERDQRRQRISELDRVYTEKENEVRNRRSELKQLAEQLGTAEAETLNLKQRLTLEELAMYRQELVRSQVELGRLRAELASRHAELKAVEKTEISNIECEMFAQNDSELKDLKHEIKIRKQELEYTSGALAEEDKSAKAAEKFKAELEHLAQEYAERMAQIRDEIRRKRVGDVGTEILRVEAAIEIVTNQQQETESEVKRLQRIAEQFGSSSIDVEMLRNNIANVDKALNSIMAEREKLRVELRSASRVTRWDKKASVVKSAP